MPIVIPVADHVECLGTVLSFGLTADCKSQCGKLAQVPFLSQRAHHPSATAHLYSEWVSKGVWGVTLGVREGLVICCLAPGPCLPQGGAEKLSRSGEGNRRTVQIAEGLKGGLSRNMDRVQKDRGNSHEDAMPHDC